MVEVPDESTNKYWHPDGGYGFFCLNSGTMAVDAYEPITMDETSMLLLKLHGSLNWRVKRGYHEPYSIDALVHDETWIKDETFEDISKRMRELYLERSPFIIPPVLVKTALTQQPILRLIWDRAYQALSTANEVTFVGYSLPATDIASRFLFGEAVGPKRAKNVKVVNLAKNDAQAEDLKAGYRQVFPGLTEEQFDFGGALGWGRRLPVAGRRRRS